MNLPVVQRGDSRPSVVECSLVQEHILRSSTLFSSAEATSYRVYQFESSPDTASLQAALNTVMGRHEALRMRYPANLAPERAELVSVEAAWPIETLTVTHGRGEPCATAVTRYVCRGGFTRTQLGEVPPFRAILTDCGHGLTHLVLTIHLLSWDGFSASLFVDELTEAYAAAASGREPQLPALDTGYLQLARLEREFFQGPMGVRRLEYWKRMFDRYGPTPVFGIDSAGQADAADRRTIVLEHSIPPEARTRLAETCRGARATEFMGISAALLLAAGRLASDETMGAKITEAGRRTVAAQRAIGPFSSGLPIWISLSPSDTLSTALRDVRSALLEMVVNAAPVGRILSFYETAQKDGTAAHSASSFAEMRAAPAMRIASLVPVPPLLLGDRLGVPQAFPPPDRVSPGFVVNVDESVAGLRLIIKAPAARYSTELLSQLLSEFDSALV